MPVLVGLISILGALIVNVSFDAEKVAFVGLVDKSGVVTKCEEVKPKDRTAIISHIKEMQEHNSVNGEENAYETGTVYNYEFFNKQVGGQVFTLTKLECKEAMERVLLRTGDNR